MPSVYLWHLNVIETKPLLTLWRPVLPYGYSYKASCASVRVPGCQKLQMMA